LVGLCNFISETSYLENLSVDGKIKLKQISRKLVWKAWAELIWVTTDERWPSVCTKGGGGIVWVYGEQL